jgi:hypothetical protein
MSKRGHRWKKNKMNLEVRKEERQIMAGSVRIPVSIQTGEREDDGLQPSHNN